MKFGGNSISCSIRWIFLLLTMSMQGRAELPFNIVQLNPEVVEPAFLKATDALICNFWGASFPDNDTDFYFYTLSHQADKKNEWWWQPQSLDVIIDAYILTGNNRYLEYYEPWYDGITRFNYEHFPEDSWKNNSVDDLEWIAITLIKMFETLGEEQYLLQAQRLYDTYIITTWGPDDEEPWRGGISWSTDSVNIAKTKNACSNGPAGIIAALLARHHDVLHQHGSLRSRDDYKQDLLKIYKWERDNLYEEASGAIYDHLGRNNIVRRVHSYNIATFFAMAMHAYGLTHYSGYLLDAMKSADYAIANLTDRNTGLMNNVSRRRKGGDEGLFHGIFFRYLGQLINSGYLPEEKCNEYKAFLEANTRMALSSLDPDVMLFSGNWATEKITVGQVAPLTPHVTGCDLLAAYLMVTKTHEKIKKKKNKK